MQDKQLELSSDVVQRSLEGNAPLKGQYDAWANQRTDFNKRLFARDPDTVREAWQRYYFPRRRNPLRTSARPPRSTSASAVSGRRASACRTFRQGPNVALANLQGLCRRPPSRGNGRPANTSRMFRSAGVAQR